MTVLTKTKRRDTKPRCEVTTKTGSRCRFHGTRYIDGRCVCTKHSSGAKDGAH